MDFRERTSFGAGVLRGRHSDLTIVKGLGSGQLGFPCYPPLFGKLVVAAKDGRSEPDWPLLQAIQLAGSLPAYRVGFISQVPEFRGLRSSLIMGLGALETFPRNSCTNV
jgi:hypothetical protein